MALQAVLANSANSNSGLGLQIARDLWLIESYQQSGSAHAEALLMKAGIPLVEDPILKVHLHFSEYPSVSFLSKTTPFIRKIFIETWVPPVGNHRTGFVSARVRSSMISAVLRQNEIVRITAAYRQLKPLNDLTAIETGASEAWEQETPLTGEGVRIAILDSGFEIDHPDLPEAVIARDYADWPDVDDDVSDLVGGHGTHVAGTVFGSSALSEGLYKGMAPDAEAVLFKIGNDSTSSASTEAVIEAIRGTVELADADIFTMSYGGFDGFNDGSSTEEQIVDWAVSEGVSAFISAGNSANIRRHYTATVPAGETIGRIQVVIKRAPPNDVYWELNMLWYDGPDTSVHIPLEAIIMDGDGEEVWQEELAWVSSPRGTESRLYSPLEPAPEDSSSFFIQVTNHSDQDQLFHFMIFSSHPTVRFLNSVSSYLVLLPSTADDCISVAASTHRTDWTDFEGNDHEYRHVVVGGIANFSSPGPRIDGALKPNITAPGQLTISCRHSENIWLDGALITRIISNDGEPGLPADYLALEGTSMSSPAAAGSAALILQANPDLTPEGLKWKLFQSAHSDSLTGETPNTRWGWGKLNVISALETSISTPDSKLLPLQLSIESVYPNPFNSSFSLLYKMRNVGNVVVNLYDLHGRLIGSEEKYIITPGTYSWSLHNITKNVVSGTYFVSLSFNDVISYRKVTLER